LGAHRERLEPFTVLRYIGALGSARYLLCTIREPYCLEHTVSTVSSGTGHYDSLFVLPVIVPYTISFGATACSLTHPLSAYHCPVSCSLYCIGTMCGSVAAATNDVFAKKQL